MKIMSLIYKDYKINIFKLHHLNRFSKQFKTI